MITTDETPVADDSVTAHPYRFRLNRAGILNVWQYDEQVFDFEGGRLLLRGANGAGKSKTLEMLLPFVLDGDKARMTASARHHTSLLWLMTDGYEGQTRVGYLWVEFARTDPGGEQQYFTCGVGIRASVGARTATAWFFTTTSRVGHGLRLDDGAGPLTRARLAEELGDRGHVFDQARTYKEHVGRTLFGLDVERYDEVLRLLYWLRQPQVGEDIEPARLAAQLGHALPQLDDQVVRGAGDTFDELVAVGEQIDRRAAAAAALEALASAYAGYATAVAAERAGAVLARHRDQTRRRAELVAAEEQLSRIRSERAEQEDSLAATGKELTACEGRLRQLQDSPEARSQRRLTDLAARLGELRESTDVAAKAHGTAAERCRLRQAGLVQDRDEITSRIGVHGESTRVLDRDVAALVPESLRSSPLGQTSVTLLDRDDAARLDELLAAQVADAPAAREALGRRQAAVTVVANALDAVEDAQRASTRADRWFAEAEARWERASADAAESARDAKQAEDALVAQIETWSRACPLPDGPPSGELTAEWLDALARSARSMAEPVLVELRTHERRASLELHAAQELVASLVDRQEEIESETEPSPPGPALGRTQRPDGAPLWKLVDFAPALEDQERAGLEAALQAAGLLDAWVRPDGRLLDREHLDTLLTSTAEGTDAGLAREALSSALVPDPPQDCDVSAQTLIAVLRGISLEDGASSRAGGSIAAVGTDGSWCLGPAQGRAAKQRAQYIGATARAEERRRQLEAVARELAQAVERRSQAQAVLREGEQKIAAVEAWLLAVPRVQPVLSAWIALEERSAVADREEALHRQAHQAAQEARQLLIARRTEFERLAAEHGVPTDADGMSALGGRIALAVRGVADLLAAVPALRRDLGRWIRDIDEVAEEETEVERLRSAASQASDRADGAAAELDELKAAVGADVAALQARLAELETARTSAQERQRAQGVRLRELDRADGEAGTGVATANERLTEAEHDLFTGALRFAELVDAPGLLAAAVGDEELVAPAPLQAIRSMTAGEGLPPGLLAAARSMPDVDGSVTDRANRVYKVHTEASTGPAADHEPRLLTSGDLLAVVGRDDGGEHPVTTLAQRVAAAVERDRALLTEHERTKFEQHILGELGEAIRRKRVEADELVAAMNRLLGGVSTSQGIRVKLDWRLRDDVPTEAREAVRLLTQPIGALLPEERADLRDCLHRLIEVSRAEQSELSYAEHLAIALDYRRWFAFRIRYTRPEADGRWADLHRRSPLSQGEQKVLCYLPLFAAAAAHFTSLAGAAPDAPRLILLDDAFPKIDVRTHPLLFGLLVQLDLDFVVTSERLWGDHDSVPSLAIYEALRDPGQRGIAQFEFRWDGRTLRAMS